MSVQKKLQTKNVQPVPVALDPKPLTKSATADNEETSDRDDIPAPHLLQMLEEASLESNIHSKMVTITPEMAEILLGNNDGNRPLKQRVIDSYTRDIAAGDFTATGETIILDENLKLLNGQHRLNACIKAGKPFPVLLVWGVPRREFKKLDSGEKRRAADWLSSEGELNSKVLGAALRVLYSWEQGAMCKSDPAPTNDELEHVLDHNPGIRQHMSSTFTKSVTGMPGSLVAALRYLFGRFDDKMAADFFERLGTGERLTRDNPILLLRNRLLTAKREKPLSQLECAALVIKTWNAFVTKEPLTVLRFRNEGKSRESFPKIAGVEYEVQATMKM